MLRIKVLGIRKSMNLEPVTQRRPSMCFLCAKATAILAMFQLLLIFPCFTIQITLYMDMKLFDGFNLPICHAHCYKKYMAGYLI